MSDFKKQTNISPLEYCLLKPTMFRRIEIPLPGLMSICGVVWISSVSTDRLVQREENGIHPLDVFRVFKRKERTKERKRRESSRSECNYSDEKTSEFPFNSKKGP